MDTDNRTCEQCGATFRPRRSDARFCPGSSKCRTAAYRANLRAAAATNSDRIGRLRAALSRVTSTLENKL